MANFATNFIEVIRNKESILEAFANVKQVDEAFIFDFIEQTNNTQYLFDYHIITETSILFSSKWGCPLNTLLLLSEETQSAFYVETQEGGDNCYELRIIEDGEVIEFVKLVQSEFEDLDFEDEEFEDIITERLYTKLSESRKGI